MFLLIITTVKYHIRFNEEKKFMEFIKTDFKKSIDAKILDKSLNGLKWITPKYSKNPMYELSLLKQTKKREDSMKEKLRIKESANLARDESRQAKKVANKNDSDLFFELVLESIVEEISLVKQRHGVVPLYRYSKVITCQA